MIQWPSLAPPASPAIPADPIELTLEDARRPRSAEAPDLPLVSEAGPVGPGPARHGRHPLALAVSLCVHAALAAALFHAVMRDGVDAETDAISVEIFTEITPQVADEPSPAGVGGEAAETPPPTYVEASEVTADEVLEKEATQIAQADGNAADMSADAPPDQASQVITGTPVAEGQGAENPLEVAPLEPMKEAAPETAVAASVPAVPADAATPAMLPPERETAAMEEPVAPPQSVLAVPPSIEAMLPPILPPQPPLLREVAEALPPPPMPRPDRPAATERQAGKEEKRPARASESSVREKRKADAPAATSKPRRPEKAAQAPAKPDRPSEARHVEGRATARQRTPSDGRTKPAGPAGAAASARASAGDLASYGRRVNGHVQRYKRYPQGAARQGIKGAVKVSISIGVSGNLAAARVAAGSGHAMLDAEALATVRRAAPYPKPPPGAGPARFSLTLRYSR